MIKFIYFDVGGVFADCDNFFKRVSSNFHIPHQEILHQWDLYNDDITRGRITSQEFWDKARSNLNIKEGEDYDFLESWISDYIPIREMYDLAIELSKRIDVGLLTNMYEGMIPLLINKHIVPNLLYKAMVISCDVGMRKPDRDIYEFAQKKAKVNPSEILLIDDREDFVSGAKDCGWQTYQFRTNKPVESINEIKRLL